MHYDLLHIACLVIGISIFVDGIGSIIVRDHQYHNVWFDGERLARALAGLSLALLALIT